jgi:S-DNA-T family DNA segregation ATPase FtsK/SpoIIIE
MTPVITESDKAVEILKWLTLEMDGRYRKLAQMRVHNIDAYNRSNKVPKPMPYIVIVVDELAECQKATETDMLPEFPTGKKFLPKLLQEISEPKALI